MVQRNFRCNIDGPGKEPKGQDHQDVSIILPPPPAPLLMKFFASIRRHLTKKQLHAKAAREACGKPVVRKEFEPRRRSLLITANQPFGEWGKVFPDQAMTLAAVDRLVHHATILEMSVKSYRCNEVLERKRGKGRPAGRATIKTTSE